MAQNIDSILGKLRELQQTIPGVETSLTRLQVLLKSSFEGGSMAAISAVGLELQNLSTSAETAIAAMSDTSKATAALNALKGTIAEVTTQITAMRTAATPQAGAVTGGYVPSNLTQQTMFEHRIDLAQMNAEMQREQLELQTRLQQATTPPPSVGYAGTGFKSGQLASLEETRRARRELEDEWTKMQASTAKLPPVTPGISASAENYDLLTQKIREETLAKEASAQASATEATATERSATTQMSALDKLIMKQRELYGVGAGGQYFSKGELTKSITAEAGGTRALRGITGGEDANAVFQRLLSSKQIAQEGAYKFKFTELSPATLDAYNKALVSLGMSAEDAEKKINDLYRGARLPAPAKDTVSKAGQKDIEDAERIANLQTKGVRSLFGSDEQYAKFGSRLKDLKLDLVDLKSATTDVASGMTTLSFQTLDKSTGILKTATVYVDEFGRIINQGTTRVKSLEDMITHNITKVMGWALALGVVYGSMQKIGELVESMKKIQDAMTDIGITTKASAAALDEVYQGVLNISKVTATDLTSGLTSFNQALRATGGAGDSSTRAALALKLLADSLTLAKLSGLETKRAMDLLIAGLKQLDQPLDSGGQLLDKFQAISNQANTSVEDMATTFAITAGAASDVGVNVNNLVALIGAFSEATSLSATETGNALRAMFSNFTQPAGVEVLNKYGIAVQDINGEFKSFIDVFQQASNLARSGILSERQVAEIANALGGGSRRQAQVTALLTVAPRQVNLREFLDQGKEAGAAEDALTQKVGTLSSAIEILQNSFDNLGKSLGNEGGFIDALTSIVTLLTKVIDLAADLTKALGPGLPLLLGGLAGYSLLKSQGPVLGKYGGMLDGAIGSPLGNLSNIASGPQAARLVETPEGMGIVKESTWGNLGTTFGKNAMSALLPILPLLAGQVAKSAETGDWSGTVGMGIGGAFMAVLSGNPIWGMIGALIGASIVEQINNNAKVAKEYGGAMAKPLPSVPVNVTAEEAFKQTEDLRKQLELLQGEQNAARSMSIARFGPESGATILPMLSERFKQLTETLKPEEAYSRLQNERFIYSRGTNFLGQPTERGFTGTQGFSIETIKKFSEGTTLLEQFLTNMRDLVIKSKDLPAEMADLVTNKAFLITKEAFVGPAMGIKAATTAGEIINTPEYEYNRRKRYEFTEQLTKGDLNTGDYKSRMEALGSTGITASLVLSALNPQISTSNVQKYKDEWLRVKDALVVADQGTQTYISSVSTNLATLNTEMEKLRMQEEFYKRGLSDLDTQGYADLQARIKDVGIQSDIARQQIEALLVAIEETNNAAQFSFKGFGDYSKYSKDEMQGMVAQARALQEIYANQTNTPLDQLVKTAPDIVTMTKEGFDTWHGVYQQFLDQVITDVDTFRQQMEEKMKFNFKSLRNVPAEMAQKLQQAMNYYTNLLKTYGFNEQNQLITVLFKDNQVGQLVGSQTALQLALEDLTEVEKKKLDGIYNLPSGATAFIPIQAGQLLSEYTKNTEPQWTRDYGATPTAPPKVGSYPLGKPTEGMAASEIIKRYLAEAQTALQQQATDLAREKYLKETGYANMVTRGPWNEDKTQTIFDKFMKIAPPAESKNDVITVASEFLSLLSKQLTTVFAPFGKMFAPKTLGQPDIFLPEIYKGMKPTEASAIKININQEKQTHEVNVQMLVNLDGRRIWDGIKRYALADYSRLSASVGDSQRSRGNII